MHEDHQENPYQPSVVDVGENRRAKKALRYISHGVYLQLFLGAGILLITVTGIDITNVFSAFTCGALLIGLGVNSLAYINRYKKALAAEN